MENLGRILKDARESKDITLKDASQVTKIGIRFLKALENNEYDSFASHIYWRYFLKSYAKFLGMDGGKMADEFKPAYSIPPKNFSQPKCHISKYTKQTLIIFAAMISVWLLWVIYQTAVAKF